MITVLISWCYIFAVCFLLGLGLYSLLRRFWGGGTEEAPVSLLAVLGMVVSTVYAEYLSCFMKIGAAAHLILLLLAAVSAVIGRNELRKYLNDAKKLLFSWEGLFYLAFLVLIAFFTSRGEFHTDTNIYHAQNIRLYEEYGLIRGMGNLQNHFAYNSSYLAFAAIFSMKWLVGQSLHTTTGFLEAMMCIYAFYGLKRFQLHKRHLADFMKLAIPFYVLVILARSMSPATDFGTMLVALYVLAAWCDNLEEEKSIFRYSLLAVISVFVLTMKFSACFIVLLALYPGICMLKKKEWNRILLCIGSGLVIVLPFLIRNVLISGWLLYPFDKIDLFDVQWKIPKEYLLYDAAQIKVWGRCLFEVELLDTPIAEWLPRWWEEKERYEQMLLGSVMMGTLLFIAELIAGWIGRKKPEWDRLALIAGVYANVAVWFFMAPFIRYGLAFLFAVPFLAMGIWFSQEKKGFYGIVTGGLVFCIVTCLSPYWNQYITDGGVFLKQRVTDPYYVCQQDYDRGNMIPVEMNGVTVYCDGTSHEINSYFACPGTCYDSMMERTTLMGESLEDGFMPK